MKIKVKIGDNENKDYSNEVEAEINGIDWLIYQDSFEHTTLKEYDRAFEHICDAIQSQNDIPYNWYIDGKIEEIDK